MWRTRSLEPAKGPTFWVRSDNPQKNLELSYCFDKMMKKESSDELFSIIAFALLGIDAVFVFFIRSKSGPVIEDQFLICQYK